MTTLQELLEQWEARSKDALPTDAMLINKHIRELRAALAQHREQQPVCHGCGIPAGDVHMSTCKSGKWPSRVSNGDTAAPAPVAQQGEQAKPAAYITDTWQGPMVWTPEMYNDACTYCDDGEFPVPLYTVAPAPPAPQAQPDWLLKTTQDLANSIRRRCFPEVPQFQVLDDLVGVISQIDNMTCGMERKSAPQAQDKSDNYLSGYCTGRTDLLKEQSAQPVAQPLAKTCDTCAHYQQGKHPGVSIHDETCYECRSYWGNKWEAA